MPSAAVIELKDPDRAENETAIPWMSGRKLTWDDFLCEPERNSDAVASTNTSLGISYRVQEGEWVYEISCNFNKPKSWGLLKTDYILAHEQAHFDLTEIFARKLYEQLQAYMFNPRTYKSDIAAIYQQIVAEKEDMQKSYDRETDHSRNKKLQIDWLKKIDEMLQDSAPFANYP